jgi:hypothetical protein
MSLKPLLSLAVFLFTASLLGCGSNSKGIEVKGSVSIDGRPLSGAQVKLLPQGANPQTLHNAATDLQGGFVLKNTGDAKTQIVPGKYVVLISKITGGDGCGGQRSSGNLQRCQSHSPED